MDSEALEDFYKRVVMDHYRRPRKEGRLAEATHVQPARNPKCGDELKIFLQVGENRIQALSYEVQGCAISVASASLMAEAVEGRSVAEARNLSAVFRRLVDGGLAEPQQRELGELGAMAAIQRVPARRQCAYLAWDALEGILATLGD